MNLPSGGPPGGAQTAREVSLPALAEELHDVLSSLTLLLRRDGRQGVPISLTQAQALRVLEDYGDRSVSELAADLWTSQPAATTLVDRMERDGLVRRGEGEADRRRVSVTATEEGRRLLALVGERRRAALASALALLEGQEREEVAAAMAALAHLVALWRGGDLVAGTTSARAASTGPGAGNEARSQAEPEAI